MQPSPHKSPETSKDRILEIVRDQPEDSTYDEILHELALGRMIERGLADSRAGRTLSNSDALKRIESWASTE